MMKLTLILTLFLPPCFSTRSRYTSFLAGQSTKLIEFKGLSGSSTVIRTQVDQIVLPHGELFLFLLCMED